MPCLVTIRFQASAPLFFDEGWPLEALFMQILRRAPEPPSHIEAGVRGLKPYTLSPLWREAPPRRLVAGQPLTRQLTSGYRWRISLLDDALTPHLLRGLEVAEPLKLGDEELRIDQVKSETRSYPGIAQESQDQVTHAPDRNCQIRLEFLTPAVLYRSELPMPLPDPPLAFRYYLSAWDTFAPRELRINFNLLDGTNFHVGITDHRLETRRLRLGDGRNRVGCLGQVTYTVMAWHKLGVEFLGHLHTLARFAELCGTGELTTRGLGQTRYMSSKT